MVVGQLLGARALNWQRRSAPWQPTDEVPGGNDRFTVDLDDGRRVFVKAAKAEYNAEALRREAEVYGHLQGSFIAELIAFEDDPVEPLLILEDSATRNGTSAGKHLVSPPSARRSLL